MSCIDHVECSYCQKRFDPDDILNLCPDCGKPLMVRYDLEKASKTIFPQALSVRNPDLWRYREILPVRDRNNIISLGEGYTPLIRAKRLGRETGCSNLYIKDESVNPTGSFKSRGMSVAVSRAKELGVKSISVPSAGNAAGALSAYAAIGEISAHVFMPEDVPEAFVSECLALGASVTLVEGLITDSGLVAEREGEKHGWFDISTLKEPYRLEGKKTMGLELAEQFDWRLPDVIIYPTGGGTGLIGMWKAFHEMEVMGWISSDRPRMIAVQSSGCAPIVRAFDDNAEFACFWENAETIADGIRVPSAVGDFLILEALRESGGMAVAVEEGDLLSSIKKIGRMEGMFVSPESGATLLALERLLADGFIDCDEEIVLFNTGSGLKYSHLIK